jgi:C1A family cysteine protease
MYPGLIASRLAIYYAGRAIEGSVFSDTGIYTRDLMKVLQSGVYDEGQWPYDMAKWQLLPPAGSPAYFVGSYSRLGAAQEGIDCLASGDPFIFAMEVPGAMDGPAVGAHGILNPIGDSVGEHCMLAVGYDNNFKTNPDFLQSGLDPEDVDDEMIKARNSWGSGFGIRGHLWLPLSYVFHPATGNDAWACHPPPAGSSATAQGAVSGVPVVGRFV